ncbi:MAG: glycosyltransferase [Propionicimonas sp.]|nr:glycosyltransferase [Propionicimonas sp.]
MRVLMVGWGSRGDVQPYVALGRGLAAAGHEVTIAAARDFEPMVTGAGLGFAPFAISLGDDLDDPVVRRWLTGSTGPREELRHLRAAVDAFAPVFADGLAAALPDAEAVVCGLLSLDAVTPWALREGRPVAAALLQPWLPTRLGASVLHPARPAATSWLNRAAGRLQLNGMYSPLRSASRLVHERLGLPAGGRRGYVRSVTSVPTVVGASPRVVPQPPDWPAHVRITGQWVEPAPIGYEPPPALADFLAAGEPPVYLGFGSMPAAVGGRLRELVLAAVGGRRVLLGGSLHDGPEPTAWVSETALAIGSIPHEWLFPRTGGVVCHGGAGTTGTALRAGVPVAVVPHMGDQPYWGRRVHELGLGPEPVHHSRLTAERLAEMLGSFGDSALRARTARFGLELRDERGVDTAVAALEAVLR